MVCSAAGPTIRASAQRSAITSSSNDRDVLRYYNLVARASADESGEFPGPQAPADDHAGHGVWPCLTPCRQREIKASSITVRVRRAPHRRYVES